MSKSITILGQLCVSVCSLSLTSVVLAVALTTLDNCQIGVYKALQAQHFRPLHFYWTVYFEWTLFHVMTTMAFMERLEELNCMNEMSCSVIVRYSHYYSSKTSLKPGRIQDGFSINSFLSSVSIEGSTIFQRH